MNYDMHLNEEPFDRVENGTKDIEYRINDEKRQKIKLNYHKNAIRRTKNKSCNN